MNAVAILLAVVFGASLFLPMPKVLRFIVFVLALLIGSFLAIGGGFSYWWDQSMRPTQASAVPFVCGLLILASQIPMLIRSFVGGIFPGDGD